MPDETTNTDAPVVAVVAEAPAEPAIAEVVPSVAPEQPVGESASLGTSEEVSATQIDAFPGTPLSENIDSPTVAEVQAVPESESPVSAPAESVVEAPAPVVTEPIQTPEQVAETAQLSVSAPVGDLGLTPQMAPFEALKFEVPPVIPAEVPQPEPARVPVFETASPVEPIKMISIFIRKLLPEANLAIQFRKRKKLDRIMGLFAKQASVTNDDAEKLLHISDATASRYLGILEKEGKIKRVGTAGRWVSYVRA